MTQKPLILAVETSAPIGSVAIALGEQMLAEATFSAPMKHSAELFPAIHSLLHRFSRKPKQTDHIYISVGPGSFTGLRIAVTIAKAMNFANGTKIVAVGTLDVIAANAANLTTNNARKKANYKPNSTVKKTLIDKIATILDAKRGQFFIAAYQKKQGQWAKILPDCLITASQFLEKFAAPDQPIWLLGPGLVYHKDKFKADGICLLDERYWMPRAEKVHLLGWKMALAGQFADARTLKPAYLRSPEAEEKYKHQP